MNKNHIITTIALLSLCLSLPAQIKYGSKQIQDACEKTGITKVLADVVDTDTVIDLNGRHLSLRADNGVVNHIGQQLFAKEQRLAMPSPAYDYLEYACLDNALKITENPFVYKNLKLQGGSWNDVIAMAQNSACSITRLDNVAYKVEWTNEAGKTITATFPIGYEKLYMMSRTEIEKKFIDGLTSCKAKQDADVEEPNEAGLEKNENGLLVKNGNHYIITLVNKNTYYKKDDEGHLILVWAKEYPSESIANMLITHDKWLTGYPVTMQIPTHDRKTVEVKVTIRQLLAYAHEQGCEAYWGCETVSENELKGTLFLYNPAYGYDHVINLTCNPQLIGTNNLSFTSFATLFSPTTNINNLFAKSKGKSKPKKIEEQ